MKIVTVTKADIHLKATGIMLYQVLESQIPVLVSDRDDQEIRNAENLVRHESVDAAKEYQKSFSKYKKGDKIKHYCCGLVVEGTIDEVKATSYDPLNRPQTFAGLTLISKHEPVRWGDHYYDTTHIYLNDEGKFIPTILN